MKKIYNIALALVAVLTLNVTAYAQKTRAEGDVPDALKLDKKVITNSDGSYTINLEAFVTGQITVENVGIPADIVLVLDVSGSMDDNFSNTQTYNAATTSNWSYSNSNNNLYYKLGDKYIRVQRVRQSGSSGKIYFYIYDTDNLKYYYLFGEEIHEASGIISNSNNPDPDYSIPRSQQGATVYSGTLYELGTPSKLQALRNAVLNFIEVIDQNDKDYAPDGQERLGNRIAIVTYSSTAQDASEGFKTPDTGSLKTVVRGLTANGGTNAHLGMEIAYNLMNDSDSKLKTVVMFTDGNPGYTGNWTAHERVNIGTYWNPVYVYEDEDTWASANSTIEFASQIKAMEDLTPADDHLKKYSKVYTVGVFNNPSNYTKVYMKKTSSDFDKATTSMGSKSTWTDTNMYTANGNGNIVETTDKFTFNATSADALNDIFESIATASGGSLIEAAGASSVVVDVVASSFELPEGASTENPGDIKAYKIKNIQETEDGGFKWSTTKETDSNIKVTIDASNNEIQVTGFDYAANWCGWDEDNNVAHGYKLLLEIPIVVKDDAVGGPDVKTNVAAQSKITLKKDKDDPGTSYNFPVPTVALPVKIRIVKQGLELGESAKFTIARWLPTQTESQATTFQTIVLTKTGDNFPEITLPNLDPNYYYKITEENWSWTYQYQDSEGNIITVSSQNTVDVTNNPFTFYNKKADTEKTTEAGVHNVLGTTHSSTSYESDPIPE